MCSKWNSSVCDKDGDSGCGYVPCCLATVEENAGGDDFLASGLQSPPVGGCVCVCARVREIKIEMKRNI